MNIIKIIKSYILRFYIWKNQKIFQKRQPYIHLKKGSDTLLIVFSGFAGTKRTYNYIRSLMGVSCDKLYILDPYGVRGSYNLFEDGKDFPEKITQNLISQVVNGGGYKRIVTAGSSKGGTCAVYFGLLNNVHYIFSGACQYYIGDYLKHCLPEIFHGMMGANASEKEYRLLNEKIPELILKRTCAKTILHLVYSRIEDDQTFQLHMQPLIRDLRETNCIVVEHEEFFTHHSDIGHCFPKYIINELKI